MCLDNWSAYLDGAIDPPRGGRPSEDDMAGTKTSGNRTARRGRRAVKTCTSAARPRSHLRILMLNARSARGATTSAKSRSSRGVDRAGVAGLRRRITREAEAEAWGGEVL